MSQSGGGRHHGGGYQDLRPQPMGGSRRRPANDSPGDYLPSKRGGYSMDISPMGAGFATVLPQNDPYVIRMEQEVAELRRELESARRLVF